MTELTTDTKQHWCKTIHAGPEPPLAKVTVKAAEFSVVIISQD